MGEARGAQLADKMAAFATCLDWLASGEVEQREAAAATLAHLVMDAGSEAGPMIASAGTALANALHQNAGPSVREAVRSALGALLMQARSCPDSSVLLHGLVRKLAASERVLLQCFLGELATYLIMRRLRADAGEIDPLRSLVRLVVFCRQEAATYHALRALAAMPACRRAVEEGRVQVHGNMALLEAIIETASTLREARDLLAGAIRMLPAPPSEAFASRETLAAWRAADHAVALEGTFLVGARLPGASLAGADLTDALLTEADLTGADLRGARIDTTALAYAQMDRCRFPEDWEEVAPLPVAIVAAEPVPVVTPAKPAAGGAVGASPAPRRRLDLRGDLAKAARRATGVVGAEEARRPSSETNKRGRLETLNTVNAAWRTTSEEASVNSVTLRSSTPVGGDRAVGAAEMAALLNEVTLCGTDTPHTPSVVLSAGKVTLREASASNQRAERWTEADLQSVVIVDSF